MLVYTTLVTWSQKPGTDERITTAAGTPFLLNGNRINGLQTRASTKSKFMYTENPGDNREAAAYLEAEESVATIITDLNATWQTVTLPLSLYTGNVATGAAFTSYILGESIVFAWQYSTTKSWVVYMEGGKRKTVLCAYSLKQIRELGNTGDLTTT